MTKTLRDIFMAVMVWNMKYMTRYLGFIARPIVRIVAANEIIACGLKSEQGQNNIIYTPYPDRNDYSFMVKETNWKKTLAVTTNNFSGELVLQVSLPEITDGKVIRIRAKQNKRHLYSPKITVKPTTQYSNNLINIQKTQNGLKIMWNKCETFKPMIYFLALQTNNINLTGIYTREHQWEYPKVLKASLNVGPKHPINLQQGQKYTIKILIIDYDGWVPIVALKDFIY